ncbi:DNA primase [Spiribacter halobius]|uniref:DNA primase n=1 Tax=Sediminicurvatus halobius TaxID=2182432 RepID=A0A2U2N770_9GAMM|nr:DNA primase [Spiribacter halobius]PWG64927.1 DNA primase [Spiribacter halobius]UEX78216.1 DNA primase [Spiribacter halobius]
MAGRIPDHFIDELLARIDIVDVVGERVQLKRSGSNHLGLCPFHSEKTPSFTVSAPKQFYHCFGCGAHGTAIRFLMEYDRLDFREAVAQLAGLAGMEMPEGARDDQGSEHGDLYRLLGRASELYQRWLREHPERQRAIDYLRGRGLSGEIAARFGIGFAPPGWDNLMGRLGERALLARAGMVIERDDGRAYDRFRDRIMFPIRDRRGRTIGFGGRVLGDGEPKYLNSPETPIFHKGQELYGLYEVLQADRHPADILVVEGYMDVVALAQHGLPRAVATLGTATSTRQVERLFRVTKDLVFCFDGDEAGRRAAWRALENALPAMRDGRQVRFLFLPEGEDPDSLVRGHGREGFEALLADASPLSDYLMERLGSMVDLRSMDGRARLVDEALPLLRRLPPDVYRHMLLERLAGLARLETGYLEAVVDGRERLERRVRSEPVDARAVRRTPVRMAVALLLQRPALAEAVPAEEIAAMRGRDDVPGLGLLMQLLEFSRDEPQITSGALLERFRDTEHEAALWKLATWDHLVPESGLEAEFRDAMARVRTLLDQQRLQYLNERLQRGELTREEWQEWAQLKR